MAQIMAAMVEATERTVAKLRTMAGSASDREHTIEAVKAVSEPHLQEIARLGKRFNATGTRASRDAFVRSARGQGLMSRLNEGAKTVKALALGS